MTTLIQVGALIYEEGFVKLIGYDAASKQPNKWVDNIALEGEFRFERIQDGDMVLRNSETGLRFKAKLSSIAKWITGDTKSIISRCEQTKQMCVLGYFVMNIDGFLEEYIGDNQPVKIKGLDYLQS